MIDKFLEGNKRFIENDFTKDREYYRKLSTGQSPTALFIGCSDSRVNLERVVDAKMGEIFVHRNIGNIVPRGDANLATVLEYAVKHLKVQDIVVFGHSDCGAMKTLDAGPSIEDAYIPEWLENAKEVKILADEKMPAPETPEAVKEKRTMIEIENMRVQIGHLRSYDFIKKAEEEGKIALHGLYYSLETGEVSKVF
jgi:carbonic anhydrase